MPLSSINCKEKSLAIHKNEGNASAKISSFSFSPDFICICLVKLTTKAKLSIASSSIGPVAFYTKYDDNNTAKENILVSCV